MDVEQITTNVESALERARTVLDGEVEKARATLQKLQREIADAGKVLTDLHDQKKQTEAELNALVKDLKRASTKVGLDHEIAESRKQLEALKVETAKASLALESVVTQQRAAEGQAAALRMEASQLAAAKSQTEAALRNIRQKFFG